MVDVQERVMKRISIRLIVAIITFVVGVAAASVWFLYLRPTPPLALCSVIKNRDSYISQDIRVRGILLGYDEMGLYAPDCEGGRSYLPVNIILQPWHKLKEQIANLNSAGTHDGSIWVKATLSGRFEKLQNEHCVNGKLTGLHKFSYDIYCYQLKVSGIDDVESVPPDVTFPD